MNIGIDISLLKIKLAGMGIYVKDMIEYFSELDVKNNYFLFTNADVICDLKMGKNFQIIKTNLKPHILWLKIQIPLLIKKYKIDVFWQPDHILPPKVKGVRYYVTVHDLSAYKMNNVALKRVEIVYKLFLKNSCKVADKVIAISKFTKNDIVQTLNIPEDKIKVIYNGDSPYKKESTLKHEEIANCINKYGISDRFIIFVGTINPRKNVLTLVRAFNELKREKIFNNIKLVIVGQYGWASDDVMKAIEESSFSKDIIVTGFVSNIEREILYRESSCMVFPSILEGFGLPILEAMSVGTPTVLSNTSSLPEIGGEAALYYNDIYDYKELSRVIKKVLTMSETDLKMIKNKGFERTLLFSKKECAIETLKLFNG